MNLNKSNFSERLRELRKEHNLTIVELSQKLNCSKSIISYWERGDKDPTLSALIKISNYFGISVDDLINVNDRIEYTDTLSKEERKIIFNFREMRPDLKDTFVKMSETLVQASDAIAGNSNKKKA